MTSNTFSRRQLLQLGAVSAGTLAVGMTTTSPAHGATTSITPAALGSVATSPPGRVNGLPVPRSWKAVPFDLTQVELAPSIFTEKRDRMLAYARAYPVDRILSNFR